ncbi:MAG: potassium channel family protein [Halobacteriales archaeon]
MNGSEIEYEPRSVKNLVADMKDTSELMVDLAYSAVLYENRELAKEVFDLEERMNVLRYHAHIALTLAARNPSEAEKLVGVFQIVGAAEKIANAADDIATVLTQDVGLPDEFRSALPEAKEVVFRAEVDEESELGGRTLGDINLETNTGVHIFAIRRDTDWIFAPDRDTQVLRGDVLFGEGPETGVERVYESATRRDWEREGAVSSEIENLDRAVTAVVEMKNISELAVGLAYSAVLLESHEVASEVHALEAKTDRLRQDLEEWVLESAARVEDPTELRGLMHLAISSEVIADAALEIADSVMRDIDAHPVFAEAIRESNEVITTVEVDDESELDGRTLGELLVESETGMYVMAIHRADDEWVYSPTEHTTVYGGDTLIARGPDGGKKRLRRMARS